MLRRSEPALRCTERRHLRVEAVDDATIAVIRAPQSGPPLMVVVRMSGAGSVAVEFRPHHATSPGWEYVLSTEDERFALNGRPPRRDVENEAVHITFERPAAVLLRGSSGTVKG
jgi:hypothetical protein